MRARRQRDQRGTAIVEFALVAVLFFTLIFAGLDFGYAFTVRENMTHAAQEALRDALVNGTAILDGHGNVTTTANADKNNMAIADVRARMVGPIGTTRNQQPTSGSTCGANGTTPGGALQVCTNYNGTGADETLYYNGSPVTVHNDNYPPCADQSGNASTTGQCMTITVLYDYKDNSIVGVPFVSALFPGQLRITATQRIP